MDTVSPPIVLLTDFGDQDPFVGIMKGVIAAIAPRTRVIDLTHGVRPQDVFQGAFTLYRSAAYFPKGTIFCCVVDPGVGTDRNPIAVKTRDYYFVGPDNGLVWPAAESSGVEACIRLENSDYFLPAPSLTFHGRDIFAPVSAHLSLGVSPEDLGPDIPSPVSLAFPRPEARENGLELTVLDRDRFGNLTLNITAGEFETYARTGFGMTRGDMVITQCHDAYGRARDDHPFVLAASSGYMEIAVKNGSAADRLGADVMDRFVLRPQR